MDRFWEIEGKVIRSAMALVVAGQRKKIGSKMKRLENNKENTKGKQV